MAKQYHLDGIRSDEMVRKRGCGKKTLVSFPSEKLVGGLGAEFVRKFPA
jgi:hypothetical protein